MTKSHHIFNKHNSKSGPYFNLIGPINHPGAGLKLFLYSGFFTAPPLLKKEVIVNLLIDRHMQRGDRPLKN